MYTPSLYGILCPCNYWLFLLIAMGITLTKDKKSPTWVLTTTDSEGFHHQLNLLEKDLDELVEIWNKTKRTEYERDKI